MEKKFALEWKKITDAWALALPPARPSIGDIFIYRTAIKKELKKKKKLNILILGSTPELRDLVSEFAKQTTIVCCDINLEMYLAMTTLVKNIHPKEMFMQSDWVTSPLKENYFDIIIGDGVITNIPFDLYRDFFVHLNNFLVKRGLFVTRNPFMPTKKYENVDALLIAFEKQGETISPEIELYLAFLSIFTSDAKKGIYSMSECRKVLAKYFDARNKKYVHPSKYISRLLNGKFLFSSLMSNKEWTCFSEEKNEKIMSSYFKIEKKSFDRAWDKGAMNKMLGGFLPIYSLRKK